MGFYLKDDNMALAINIVLEQIRFILAVTSKSHPKRQKILQGFALLAYMQAADKDKSVQDFSHHWPKPHDGRTKSLY